MALIRWSARSRSKRLTTLPSTKRYSGTRRATSSRTAASPDASRRAHGPGPPRPPGTVRRRRARAARPHGRTPGGRPQVTRVESARLDRHVRLGHEVLVAGEGPHGGALTGLVAVEGEDHLAAELVVGW